MTQDYFPIHFNAQGHLLYLDDQETLLRALLTGTRPVTDLWLFSHGWRTDQRHADEMYTSWTSLIQERIAQEITDTTYNPLFAGIYWPSLNLADDVPDVPGPLSISPALYAPSAIDLGALEIGADEVISHAEADGSDRMEALLEIGEADAAQIAPTESGGSSIANSSPGLNDVIGPVDKAQFIEKYRSLLRADEQSVTQYEQDLAHLYDLMMQSPPLTQQQIEEFVAILYRYKVDDPHSDPSEQTNILQAPEQVVAHLYTEADVAFRSRQESFRPGNLLRDFLSLFTFWTMKGRAAIVGQKGVAPLLFMIRERLQEQERPLRIHLMGHSFGAKLVSATVYEMANLADGTDLQPPVVDSLILVLGAFSQFAFSDNLPFKPESSGKYANIIQRHLVANPIVAIYSRHDRANRVFYPRGMFMDRSGQTYERGGPHDHLGAIGANGAQGLAPAISRIIELQPVEVPYDRSSLSGLSCLNIDGQKYINKIVGPRAIGAHGDIYRPEIFHLALAVSGQ